MINILDEFTIKKIAAGEIIENPASIVKELLENSIDAGAKNITIEIKNSPTDFIRISDDGSGISREDISKAFLRHATSKLKSSSDLFNIHSLGFRGEALASISTVSKVLVITKTDLDETAIEVEVKDSKVINKKNISSNTGTTFFIKDVFYNQPVRKKYLKSDNLEFSYIYEVVEKIALSRNDISITLIRDGKTLISSKKNENLKNHIHSILGSDIARNLIEILHVEKDYKIHGFISNNMLYRSTRKSEYIYINGRYVKNLEISKSIEKNYKSLIPLNKFPVFILYVEIDPELVDVNIHPKKHEVKLSNENRLIEILENLVKEKLFKNTKIFKIEMKENEEEKTIFEKFKDDFSFEINSSSDKNSDVEESFIEVINSNDSYDEDILKEFENDNLYFNPEENYEYEEIKLDIFESSSEYLTEEDNILKDLISSNYRGTLFKTYLVFEGREDRFYIVDQHAAHERVNYEKFKKEFEESKVSSQILLSPILLEVTAEERSVLLNNLESLKELGFSFDSFGESSFILREVPIVFGSPSSTNFLHEILEDSYDNLYKVDPYKIMRKACKASVKAGDELSIIEINALINSLSKCDKPLTCPHGRPTVIELNKKNLERLFLR